ncbi:HipA family kinase [Morganella morganii]|uniref:HipA family kinase n=2 Tax=Morganella morganii TaxID=582 RepID=UPI001CEC4810|nr:HipA family kinase [Morganella morganii]
MAGVEIHYEDITVIRVGRLHPGGERIGEGQHNPIKGVASFQAGDDIEELVVFAKELSDREMSIEIICATLGRKIGLPIPEPVILFDDDEKIFFGSIDAEYPSLAHYIKDTKDPSIELKLSTWGGLSQAAFFDEWIAMDDRNNGNLLFDGEGFILIDHESAIPSGLQADQSGIDFYFNQLLDILLCNLDRNNEIEVQKLANDARAWSQQNSEDPTSYTDNFLEKTINEKNRNQLMSFLSSRIEILGAMLYHQIKPNQMQMQYDAKS